MDTRQRVSLAAMLALLLHVIFAAMLHPQREAARSPHVIVQRIAVLHLHRRPIPKPRHRREHRKLFQRHLTRAASGARALGVPAVHRGGNIRHVARHMLPPTPPRELSVVTQRPALPAPFHDVPAAQRGTGGGSSAANGSGGGAAGTALGGAGTGLTGSGSAGGVHPCGEVLLNRFGPIKYIAGRPHVSIRALVPFSNGTTGSEDFPYQFVYDGDADDPFSHQNEHNFVMPVLVQQPPAGTDVMQFPAVIRFILDHTQRTNVTLRDGSIVPAGLTILEPCPQGDLGKDDGPSL